MSGFKPGDGVIVTTVNNGTRVVRKRTVEVWGGVIFAPSLMGPGWWLVERVTPKRIGKGGLNTVPEGEMKIAEPRR